MQRANIDGWKLRERPSVMSPAGPSFTRKAEAEDGPYEPKPFMGFGFKEEEDAAIS